MKREKLLKTATKMRKNLTRTEREFAWLLKLWGVKYQTQQVMGPWIPDFYIPSMRLIIELDGPEHFKPGRFRKDLRRNEWFKERGFRILHIQNHEVPLMLTKQDLINKVNAL